MPSNFMTRRSGTVLTRCWKMSRLWWVWCWPLSGAPPNAKTFLQFLHLYLGVPNRFTPYLVQWSPPEGSSPAQSKLGQRGAVGSRYWLMRSLGDGQVAVHGEDFSAQKALQRRLGLPSGDNAVVAGAMGTARSSPATPGFKLGRNPEVAAGRAFAVIDLNACGGERIPWPFELGLC